MLFQPTNNQEHRSIQKPVVGGVDFVAKKDWRAADSLFDDPAALGHTGNQLQHGVPLLIGYRITQAALQKPVAPTNNDANCNAMQAGGSLSC